MQFARVCVSSSSAARGGTPLMLAALGIARNLPLKILVSEERDGKVWISNNTLAYLGDGHSLLHDLLQNTAVVETVASGVAQ